jgi:membrane protease YdiL (CAAX protease family)
MAFIKLTAYITCIILALEHVHRLYYRYYRTLRNSELPTAHKTILGVALTWAPLLAALLITGVFCVFVDKISLADIGLKLTGSCGMEMLQGMGVALFSVTVMFAAGWYCGWFQIHPSAMAKSKDSFSIFCGGMSDLFTGSAFEELAMRGYVFYVLQGAVGGHKAIIISAVIFAALHWIKHPKMPLIFAVNGTIFGLLAGHYRLATDMLWIPIGLHFGYNMAMGSIYGMPCSGRAYEDGLVTCTVEGPAWVTGGMYSPDAGLLGTFAMLTTTAATLAVIPLI